MKTQKTKYHGIWIDSNVEYVKDGEIVGVDTNTFFLTSSSGDEESFDHHPTEAEIETFVDCCVNNRY